MTAEPLPVDLTHQRGWLLLRRIVQASDQQPSPTPADLADLIDRQVAELQRSLEGQPLSDHQVLEHELRGLLCLHWILLRWAQRLDAAKGIELARFTRAWNETSARMVQLIRARHDLGHAGRGGTADLLREVQEVLDRELPPKGGEPLPIEPAPGGDDVADPVQGALPSDGLP